MKRVILIILFTATISSLSAQQFLDEMIIEDISREKEIRSTIIRDPKQALLIIKTQIPNLRVSSNNVIFDIEEKEPGLWHVKLKPGTHRILLQAEGFISNRERFYFNAKDVKGILIKIQPAEKAEYDRNSGIVVINSQPQGAEVYINDELYGITPYLGRFLAGRYNLKLKKEFFMDHEEFLVVIPTQTHPVSVDLKPEEGQFSLNTSPRGAEVFLDSIRIGTTPVQSWGVPVGEHTLEIKMDHHQTVTQSFEIKNKNDKKEFSYDLIPNEAYVKFVGSPSNAVLNIAERSFNLATSDSVKLAFGKYIIELEQKGYFSLRDTIDIKTIQALRYKYRLQPKNKNIALLWSSFLPGSGQIYSGNDSKGWILGAAALTGTITTIILNSQVAGQKDTYFENRDAYQKNVVLSQMTPLYNEMIDSYDKMEQTSQTVKILGGITAAIWIYNMVDAYFLFPEQKNNISFSVKSDIHYAGITLNFCIQ